MKHDNNTPNRKGENKMANYINELINDIKDYINYNEIEITEENKTQVYEDLYDTLFVSDSVTGNASGSYTFDRYKAESNVKSELPLLFDACQEFGESDEEVTKKLRNREWEWADVTIRCYLLGEALTTVIDEYAEIDTNLQSLGEAERIVRKKLTDYFREEHDWEDTFDFGKTTDIIDTLYDSFCDDCFWAIAKVTLTELNDYLEEASETEGSEVDEEYADSLLARVTRHYLFCKENDLMK